MKTVLTKCIPALLTSAVLSASAGCIVTGAECSEESTDSVSTSSVALVAEVEAMQTFGEISSEEAQMLLEEIAAIQSDNSDSFTYVDYDYYTSSAISPTSHYFGVLAKSGVAIGKCDIYLYLNTNLLESDYSSDNRFIIGNSYKDSDSDTKIDVNIKEYSDSRKQFIIDFTTSLTKTPDCSALFVYDLGDDFYSVVKSEKSLHNYTNEDTSSTSVDVENSKDYILRKCIYSLGDVDRNGDVDDTDVNLITKHIVGLGSGDSLDEAAFKLAADANRDGTVNIMDVITINRYLNGNDTL